MSLNKNTILSTRLYFFFVKESGISLSPSGKKDGRLECVVGCLRETIAVICRTGLLVRMHRSNGVGGKEGSVGKRYLRGRV